MSYVNYPGLAESPPPPTGNTFYAKSEPFDSGFDRNGNALKRQPPNSSFDSWASISGASIATGRFSVGAAFAETGRRDAAAASAAVGFFRQSPATSSSNVQEHNTHSNGESTAFFSEEFRGHHSGISPGGVFQSDFSSLHPRTKSRFDEIILEEGQRMLTTSATEFLQRHVYVDDGGGGEEIQKGDAMAMPSAAMAQPHYQKQHQQQNVIRSDEQQQNEAFYRPRSPNSAPVAKKRTFAEISAFDSTTSGHSEAKVPRVILTSYPAAPPAVLKNYAEDRRYSMGHFHQNEKLSPLEGETQNSLLDLRQELAFIDSFDPSVSNCLQNSRRLLLGESTKLEEWHNPDWVEVDINRPIKLSKQVLVPTFRYPTVNFVGRIVGFKGTTLARICRKYKCFISILGANSTKDRRQEIELLQSGDYRFAHYASPLHIRIDVIAPTHLAHMRIAGVLNLLHKLLVPNRDFDIDAELADVDLSDGNEKSKSKNEKIQRWAEEERRWESEFEQVNANGRTMEGRQNYWPRAAKAPTSYRGTDRRWNNDTLKHATASFTPSPALNSSSASLSSQYRGASAARARGGGFVPRRMRPRGEGGMNE